MKESDSIKKKFLERRDKLFHFSRIIDDSLKFSVDYSLLIEEFIRTISIDRDYNFALVSAGSFSRRELSPYSDIDLIFIHPTPLKVQDEITELVTRLWDSGIEVSHTVRDYDDLNKYLEEDLHTFTQFFETRFLLGKSSIYNQWNKKLISLFTDDLIIKLSEEFIQETSERYSKYGASPKMIEPNIKMSAGGLRDLHIIEWLYILRTKQFFDKQVEKSQTELFISALLEMDFTTVKECGRILDSYKMLLKVRNLLHLLNKSRVDRFEADEQLKVAKIVGHKKDGYRKLMKDYFVATNVISRFKKSYIKRLRSEIYKNIPDHVSIEIDDHFSLKGELITCNEKHLLSISDIMRGYYYRGIYNAFFDEKLRMKIIDSLDNMKLEPEKSSSVFFREIMRLSGNVGITLSAMHELGVLDVFLTEFADLSGFIQHGVYHSYSADEHTLLSIINVEKLADENSNLGSIYRSIDDKEILFLSLLFHDIAKPIDVSGHEIIGAEIASSVMIRLGYSDEEIEQVTFLVKNHLLMEQVAFRRNLNEPETLNNFTLKFNSVKQLNLLYLLTYADLSAVNPALWTSWKSDLLFELYRKSKLMLEEKISGEELLISSTSIIPSEISRHSTMISDSHVKDHFESIEDFGYISHFTDEEIAQHIQEINSGLTASVLFKELDNFTNITVITNDSPFLLSKLCGVLSINDLNIHDAKIFTRKDGIVIDNFNVTDFRTHKVIMEDRYPKIVEDFKSVVSGILQLGNEITKMKSKWWRIENKFFKRPGQIKIQFEEIEKYTIIDVFSPDRLGFLYQVTRSLNELGLNIYFAKIATNGDNIVDSFYVLDSKKKKVSPNFYPFIETELIEAIKQIL